MVVLYDVACIVCRLSVAFFLIPFAIEEWQYIFRKR